MRIAVDWGSTHFRAMLVNDHGQVVDRVESTQGILSSAMQAQKNDNRFAQVIEQHCRRWLSDAPSLTCFLGGMIGSRNGWQEVPYLDNSRWLSELATQLQQSPEGCHFFIPGVQQNHKGHWDVMRGEETQILGAVQILSDCDWPRSVQMLLPGTHSKWAQVSGKKIEANASTIDAKIDHFSTYMTGEIYHWAHQNSSLSGLMTKDSDSFDATAFDAGIAQGESTSALSQLLFTLRADSLMDALPGHSCADYLSGLLIGHEIASALVQHSMPTQKQSDSEIVIIGNGMLAKRYQHGLERFGRSSRLIDVEDAYCRGVLTIDQLAKIHR